MSDPEKFIAYIRDCLELDECSKVSILKELSSNLLLIVEDEGQKYIVKKYNSKLLFKIEVFILQRISALKVPQIIYYEEHSNLSWNWIVYDYIEGESLYSLRNQLDTEYLLDIFIEVGQFLKSYHQLSIVDEMSAYNDCRLKLIDRIELDYSLAIKNAECDDLAWVITFMRNAYDLLKKENYYGLTITDFTDKHLLIRPCNKGYCLSGVIDFEMVRFFYKFSDFVLLYICYFLENRRLEDSFLNGYGMVLGKEERILIAFFILQYALELCGSSRTISEYDNKKEGRKIIHAVKVWLFNNNLYK